MNVNLDSHKPSKAIERVKAALCARAPAGITFSGAQEADLVVMHVVGRNSHRTQEAREYLRAGKPYVVIQYAMKSTRNPDPQDWAELWNGARMVFSYYDLPAPNLYRSPLAAEPDMFFQEQAEKKYAIGTLGNSFQAECIGEVHMALWQTAGTAVHVGQPFDRSPVVDYVSNPDDPQLRGIYNSCLRFSCLRRKEGFEIPAVESLFCGVRPILFDTPEYRHWFDGLADFIPETGIVETVKNLKKILTSKPRPVSKDEIAEARRRFDWNRIVKGFWEQCLT